MCFRVLSRLRRALIIKVALTSNIWVLKSVLFILNKLSQRPAHEQSHDIYTGKYSWTQVNFWILKQDFLSLPCGTCNSEFPENQIIKINTKIYSDVFFTYFDTFHFVS